MDKETVIHENRLVANEWKEFAKSTAFRKLMEYIEFQDYAAVQGAKGPILTFDDESGTQINFDPQKAATLLQRSVGYDIIKTYIESYVNFTTKQ